MGKAKSGKKIVKRNKEQAGSEDKVLIVKNKIRPESKQAMLIKLLERPSGATIDEMAKATNWQRHSVRGVMSGILKKRLGFSISSEKEERGRIYRIVS